MTAHPFTLSPVHSSWRPCITTALNEIDPSYLSTLANTHWLPGPAHLLNAFSLPLQETKYILIGESPYPRASSANGYAFWDAAVDQLWSSTGLSKPVNRATSLRNIIKMLLLTENLLKPTDLTQAAITAINKQPLVQTNQALFGNFLNRGFLLLNATLVLHPARAPDKDAKQFFPFLKHIIDYLVHEKPTVTFVLLGRIAKKIAPLLPAHAPKLIAEHPYQLSFITSSAVQNFFRPLHLLMV